MVTSRSVTPPPGLARQARERFVMEMDGAAAAMAAAAQERLVALTQLPGTAKEMQERMQAFQAFQQLRAAWVPGVRQTWRKAWTQPHTTHGHMDGGTVGTLTLIEDDEVETRIQVSRLALALTHTVTWELNDLRLRVQHLEKISELAPHDVFRPEVLAGVLIEQWLACGLTRESWELVQDHMRAGLAKRLLLAYHHANEFLIQQGVLPEIDLKPLLKRSTAGAPTTRPSDKVPRAEGGGNATGAGMAAGGASAVKAEAGQPGQASGAGARTDAEGHATAGHMPPSRALQRAQGVFGQLKRLVTEKISGLPFGAPAAAVAPSPALAEALQHSSELISQYAASEDIEAIHARLRQQSAAIKSKASTASEKATVEIVALMFQSILSEERIPAGVRVWFARLQMPVLRVALAEPEFFSAPNHPARQLIDRMGSCVMGFDAGVIGGSALETEIRRVVQVIEQYPETGSKVFQLVLGEFQKFLAGFLTDKDLTRRVVSVAQQVEQKETLAIQYTIELRNMLNSVPVREEIREFLFKVWAEVLAMAAVRHGAQHEDTLSLKRVATDLLWTASAKPNRQDRAQVVKQLPQLLQRLRTGMSLLGLSADAQEAHIKAISDTLADAFMSRTELIPQSQLDDMARRLANLADVVGEATTEEIQLDSGSIEAMLGLEFARIDVIAEGGSHPSDAMLAWARELQLGSWFKLDHNNEVRQAQLVWRSDRGQLHLFVAADGRTCLFQVRRLAAYLQAGLLVPAEEDALTVRATRDALAKLDANPDRLLR